MGYCFFLIASHQFAARALLTAPRKARFKRNRPTHRHTHDTQRHKPTDKISIGVITSSCPFARARLPTCARLLIARRLIARLLVYALLLGF